MARRPDKRVKEWLLTAEGGKEYRIKKTEEAWAAISDYKSPETRRGMLMYGHCSVDGCVGFRHCKFHRKYFCTESVAKGKVKCKYGDFWTISCNCDRQREIFYASNQYIIAKLLYDAGYRFYYDEHIGKYRPDILFATDTMYIVVEVDEFRHVGYEAYAELTRMINIQTILDKPIIFIHFNVDAGDVVGSIPDNHKTYLLEVMKWAMSSPDIIGEGGLRYKIAIFYMFYDIYDVNGGTLKFLMPVGGAG